MATRKKRSVIVRLLIIRLNRIRLPGFMHMGLYDVLRFFIRSLIEYQISMQASAVAFRFFMALFPTLIFSFTLIPYVPVNNLDRQILTAIAAVFPPQSVPMIKETMGEILYHKRGGLLSFGFFFTLFLATSGTNALLTAFNRNYEIFKHRNFLKQRMYSTWLTLLLFLELITGAVLLIFGERVFGRLFLYLHFKGEASQWTITLINWGIVMAMIFVAISFLYYYGASLKDRKDWKFISPGSLLSSTCVFIASFGFKYYVTNFANYNKLYGSLGTMIILMVWFYIMAAVMIVGFDLNSAIQNAVHHHRQEILNRPKENYFMHPSGDSNEGMDENAD